MRWNIVSSCALVLVVGIGCGGGGGGGTGNDDPVLTSLNVNPTTLTLAVGETKPPIAVSPRDQSNRAMSGLPAPTFTTNNDARATVSNAGAVTGVSAGTATITASITHGGVTKTGTTAVTVLPPDGPAPVTANVSATVNSTFNPDSVRIAKDGTVTWNFGSLDHNVVFNAVAGRPADIGTTVNAAVPRTFTTAGTFPYRCTIHAGMDGKVVVAP